MKSELSITLIQTNIFWKDISKNINQISKRLEVINGNVDIILLPEMFSSWKTSAIKGIKAFSICSSVLNPRTSAGSFPKD